MYCICCKGNKVKPNQFDESLSEEDMIWKKEKITVSGITKQSNINNSIVNDGIIHIIEARYGSKYDGDRIILAICDDCIEENLQDGTLLYFGNYIISDESHIKEAVDTSKKIYMRRKNLDNLV
jgi:hypothetical protein